MTGSGGGSGAEGRGAERRGGQGRGGDRRGKRRLGGRLDSTEGCEGRFAERERYGGVPEKETREGSGAEVCRMQCVGKVEGEAR